MATQKLFSTFFFLALFSFGCGQNTGSEDRRSKPSASINDVKDLEVGGPCDECRIMYDGIPSKENINSLAVLAEKKEAGERMELKGKVTLKDGKTPASDVVLYIYHTDASGRYSPGNTQLTGQRHGRLRGWVKTDSNGRFSIQSIRPASYPNSRIPAHLHILVKESGKTLYYIDEVVFTDDPFVTDEERGRAQKRGGSQIISLRKDSAGVWVGDLSVTLGLNIPGYPK